MTTNRILVVEDESIIGMELQFRLQDIGYDVLEVVPSGERAIEVALAQKPDLILMDIHLEGDMDGIAATEAILARQDVPIIFLTAHTDEDTLERAKNSTPHGYLVKPFQEKELDIAIQMALAKHKMERKLRESEERLRLVIESGDDIISVHDLDGTVTYFHAAKKYNLIAADVIGVNPQNLLADIVPEWLKSFRYVQEMKQSTTAEMNVTFQGREFWFNVHFYPIKDKNGNVTAIATIARDVTDVKRLKGILPVCAWCGKKIKNENGEWERLDTYITSHTEAIVSHGMCNDCQQKFHP